MHPKTMGPLGMFGIAKSQLERIGYNPLEASNPMGEPMSGGGGGGGFSMGFGGQRPMNDMERTIAAHDYPGGFKVATDQYAAKYSDQLDEAAIEELKYKYPNKDWDQFAIDRQNIINQVAGTDNLWGPVPDGQGGTKLGITRKDTLAPLSSTKKTSAWKNPNKPSKPSYYMNKGKSSGYGLGGSSKPSSGLNWKKYTGDY